MQLQLLTAAIFLIVAHSALAQGQMPGIPGMMRGQDTTPPTPMSTQGPQSAQPGMGSGMGGGMSGMGAGGGMSQSGMGGMCGMMGRMGQMGGTSASGMSRGMVADTHMMKIMFAVADTNGDGGLSFDEVTAVHKRIFDTIDANKDGKATPDELQRFMQQ